MRKFIEKYPYALSDITIAKIIEDKKSDKRGVPNSSIENLLQSIATKDASTPFNESKLYLAFNAVNAYHVNNHAVPENNNKRSSTPPTPTSLIYTGVSQSDRMLLDNTLSTSGPGILNSAAVHLNVALKTHWGRGRLCGQPAVVGSEKSLGVSIWILGGIRYCLKLIELSQVRI